GCRLDCSRVDNWEQRRQIYHNTSPSSSMGRRQDDHSRRRDVHVRNPPNSALPGADAALLDFFSSRRRQTILVSDWSSDVCSSDLPVALSCCMNSAPPVPFTMRMMKGTGGALFVQQLKAAGVEHIFFNPSTGDYPIFDALVDE